MFFGECATVSDLLPYVRLSNGQYKKTELYVIGKIITYYLQKCFGQYCAIS